MIRAVFWTTVVHNDTHLWALLTLIFIGLVLWFILFCVSYFVCVGFRFRGARQDICSKVSQSSKELILCRVQDVKHQSVVNNVCVSGLCVTSKMAVTLFRLPVWNRSSYTTCVRMLASVGGWVATIQSRTRRRFVRVNQSIKIYFLSNRNITVYTVYASAQKAAREA